MKSVDEEKEVITAAGLRAEAQFQYNFDTDSNNTTYQAMHPNRQLFAEGTDNNGTLPPLDPSVVTLTEVLGDTRFGLRAVA